MPSESGSDTTGRSSPSPSHGSARPRKIKPHFERMLPHLQVNMHTNQFHTEHEDYIFTLPALTTMVESHMDRPAVVAAQPKIWNDNAPPEQDNGQTTDRPSDDHTEDGIQAVGVPITAGTPDPDRPVTSNEGSETHEHPASMDLAGDIVYEDGNGDVAWVAPAFDHDGDPFAPSKRFGNALSEFQADLQVADSFLPLDDGYAVAADPVHMRKDAPGNKAVVANEAIMKQVQQLLNTSASSNRTNTSNTDLVIADYMVMALEDPNMELDQELVNATSAAVREEEARRGKSYDGLPKNYIPRYRADIPDDDSDDDEKKKDSDDPAYQPSGPRKATTRDPYHIRQDPPQVQRTPQHQPTTEDLDLSDVGGYALEKLDWLDQDRLEAGMDKSEPGDKVCNTEAAFKRLKNFARFLVAMLIECKQSVSRQEEGQVYGDTKFTRLREAQRQLMKQASYLLTSNTWGKRQDSVVAMAMIGDWWSWSEFEKRIGYDKPANWDEYTYENRPIRTSRPWSQLVQWGSPASDRAMQKMMQRVNELFPGAGVALPPTLPSTSTSHPGSPEGPDGEVPLPEAPDSADPNAPSKNRVQLVALDPMSADYWDGADPGDDDEARSGDGEDHGEDDADSPEGAGEVFSSEREVSHHDDEDQHAHVVAATSDPEARSLDLDVTMDEPKRTPSGGAASGVTPVSRAPASHLPWRDLRRYDSEDSLKADDTQLPLIARADAVDADGSVTRRLHGEKTQATFDVFSNMRLGDGTGPSTKPPDGSSTQKHAQDVPTLPAPDRGYGDSPERTQATSGSNRQRDTALEHTHAIDETVNTTEHGSFAPSSTPEGAPAASVAPLGPRMQYRQLLRTDTQDTELTSESGHLAHPAGDDDNDANKEPTDRTGGMPLTGQATQATLDALAAISISPNESAGPSISAPIGGNGHVDASIAAATAANAQGGGGGDGGGGSGGATGGHVPINPDNPLKRSAPDDSDDEEHAGDAHVSKKAKRAPANTEPSAQAGPGPSTQAARGQAASTRGKRKILVMPPSMRTLRSHGKTKKAPKKG